MKQEDKEILLKDLCGRLPYDVKCQVSFDEEDIHIETLESVRPKMAFNQITTNGSVVSIDIVKPYLRPISSMTEDEVNKLFKILKINENNEKEWLKVNDINIIRLFTEEGKDFYEIAEALDYLNSIHVDYRELIEKGLAIEVTDENNPYK